MSPFEKMRARKEFMASENNNNKRGVHKSIGGKKNEKKGSENGTTPGSFQACHFARTRTNSVG